MFGNFNFRRSRAVSKRTRVTMTERGPSVSHKRGRVSITSKGNVTVRILPGLSWRVKLW